MKFRTTMKEVKSKGIAYCFGYCDIHSIMCYDHAIAYTCGTYGWNADIYQTDYENTVIVTGYRPFGYSLQDGNIANAMEKCASNIPYDASHREKITEIRNDLFRLIHADYSAIKVEYSGSKYERECIDSYNRIHDALVEKYKEWMK